jgi:peroxiredoxin family protein
MKEKLQEAREDWMMFKRLQKGEDADYKWLQLKLEEAEARIKACRYKIDLGDQI